MECAFGSNGDGRFLWGLNYGINLSKFVGQTLAFRLNQSRGHHAITCGSFHQSMATKIERPE